MNKLSLLLAAAATAFATSAAPLTPEQALQAAIGQRPAAMAAASVQAMQHVLTVDSHEKAALYVFARAELPGFVITAADDCIENLVIGYSDRDAFTADNMPPALQDWLDAKAAEVAAAAAAPAPSQTAPAPMRISKTERQAISPLCSTKWNQDAPYNNLCPIVDGSRSVTGCVATAVAQIMKKHNYPSSGTGSHSYSWSYNNHTYSTSANFGATTYDWGNMLNTYTSSASTTQKNAVATLMFHCGVMCDMEYSPNESGAAGIYASQGMIKYFNYDKGMKYLYRSWFNSSDWSDLMYAELAAGRPIQYSGRTSNDEGHAFVCDGYSSNNYFHINWGWGGSCDGYYTLSQLNPEDQGIGGSSSGYSFNYDQTATIGIRPNAGTTEYAPVMEAYGFSTDKTSYSRNYYTDITFGNGFYSYALGTVNYTIGFILDDGSNPLALTYVSTDLDLGYGFSQMTISAESFPEGSYEVYPAFKTSTSGWQVMYCPTNLENHLHFDVTASTINVSAGSTPGTGSGSITANYTGFTATTSPNGPEIYPGHSYNFNFDITSTGTYDQDLACLIYTGGSAYAISDYKNVSFTQAGSKSMSWNLNIPSNLPTGDYGICLAYNGGDGYLYIVDNPAEITVKDEPVPVVAEFTASIAPSTPTEYTVGDEVSVSYNITSTAAGSIDVSLKLFDKNGTNVIGTQTSTVEFSEAGTVTKTFAITLSESTVAPGEYYLRLAKMATAINVESYLTEPFNITVKSNQVIGDITVSYTGYTATTSPNGPDIYPGHSYNFNFDITSTGIYDQDLACIIYTGGSAYAISDYENVSFTQAGSKSMSWNLNIPSDLPTGDYGICLAYNDGDGYLYIVDNPAEITVKEEPKPELVISLVAVMFPGSDTNGTTLEQCAFIPEADQQILVDLKCTQGEGTVTVHLCFYDLANGTVPIAQSQVIEIDMSSSEEAFLQFKGPWTGIETSTIYRVRAFVNEEISDFYYFNIEPTDGIGAVTADGEAQYFNLQGLPVKNPRPGGMYIKVENGSAYKITKE